MNLSEAWESYRSDKTLLGYSKHTLKAYKIQADVMIRHFTDVPITDITYEGLKAYLMKDVDRLKPASLGHRVRFLKSLFRWAMDEGYITKNVAAGLKEPKLPQRVPKALSEEEVELLRESCTSPLEHAIIEFMYTTGCRVGEVVQVNRDQVSIDKAIIVHGKGSKDREVFYNTRCEIWLRKYLESRTDDNDALFVNERRPHNRMSISQMRYVVKRIARRAGLKKNIYPHTLRHSYAMNLLNNGAPMEAIQSLLGHSKMEATRIYAELNGPMRRDLYKKYF